MAVLGEPECVPPLPAAQVEGAARRVVSGDLDEELVGVAPPQLAVLLVAGVPCRALLVGKARCAATIAARP